MPKREAIHIGNLTKHYGLKEIFQGASASVLEGQVYGVIGRNGAGKSTLFRIILDQEEADDGGIDIAPWVQLGYIPQEDPFLEGESVMEFLERWTHVPSWDIAKQAHHFELADRLDVEVLSLSGGYRMRVKLLAMILANPNVILLDEPTNYLDLSTILLLERWIRDFSGTVLLITHDREFLRRVATATIEVDQGAIITYQGTIDEYLEYKQEQLEFAMATNEALGRKQAQLQRFVDRFGAKSSLASLAKSKEKQIARMESAKHTIYVPDSTVRMYIPPVFHKNGMALEVEKLMIGYPHHSVAGNISLDLPRGAKVAILGDNGQGKSTLAKTLAGFLEPLGGEYKWAQKLRIGYFGQHMEEELPYDQEVYDYFRAQVSYDISDEHVKATLGSFLFQEADWTKPIAVLSGGEKSRLNLANVFLGGYDVLILDEPTNHLDVETVEIMARSLKDFVGTVLIVSHDRTFVNLLADTIWEVDNGSVRKYPGTYQEYVWSLEQRQAPQKSETKQQDTAQQSNSQEESPEKQLQRELYDTKKQLQKIERKIADLKDDVRLGSVEAQLELFQQEELWIKVAEHAEWLESQIM